MIQFNTERPRYVKDFIVVLKLRISTGEKRETFHFVLVRSVLVYHYCSVVSPSTNSYGIVNGTRTVTRFDVLEETKNLIRMFQS